MKTAIIISEGIKQVMFTPENDTEKEALKMFTKDDDVELGIYSGAFATENDVSGFEIGMNQAGFLRAWKKNDSVMFVLRPKR